MSTLRRMWKEYMWQDLEDNEYVPLFRDCTSMFPGYVDQDVVVSSSRVFFCGLLGDCLGGVFAEVAMEKGVGVDLEKVDQDGAAKLNGD
jgi:hypothetical protein